MNRFRLISSFALLIFAVYCLIWDTSLPFSLPIWVYICGTIYFAFFPIKDIISALNRTLYKGRQFKKNYIKNEFDEKEFKKTVHKNNIRAVYSFIFWIFFMSVPATLYFTGVMDKVWIFALFALSNFSVFFAVFFWCPFRSIFIRPDCCLECRIYNWDSFFQYSFLILIPNVFTIIIFSLGCISLIEWEVMHKLFPQHFYKQTNKNLKCENCDMEACSHHKKRFFSNKLKDSEVEDENCCY